MSPESLKAIAVVCLLVVVGALFVAADQYQTNAQNVRAMNENPLALLATGGHEVQPAMPPATKYAILVAVLAGIGGVISLFAALRAEAVAAAPGPEPDAGDRPGSS